MLYNVHALQSLPKKLTVTEFISVLFIWIVLNSVEPKIVDDFLSKGYSSLVASQTE